MSKNRFSRFEDAAQRMVDGAFRNFFRSSLQPQEIATKLGEALEESAAKDDQPATKFRVRLHPSDFEEMNSQNSSIAVELAHYVRSIAKEAKIQLLLDPEVYLVADSNVRPQEVVVETESTRDVVQRTAQMDRLTYDDEIRQKIKELDAFLIVDGRRHIPLSKTLITLGRRVDNDVVVLGDTVSRQHAQIRWKFNHYVIYDSDSSTGTRVNKDKVAECVLHRGDVIELGGQKIVYSEGLDHTSQISAVSDDNLTQQTKALPAIDNDAPKEEPSLYWPRDEEGE